MSDYLNKRMCMYNVCVSNVM